MTRNEIYISGLGVRYQNAKSLADVVRTSREYRKAKCRDYTLTSPSGERVDIHNLRAFCRLNGLSESSMRDVVRGKSKTCQGWTK